MKKQLTSFIVFILLSFYFSNSKAQDTCILDNIKLTKNCLIESLGAEWYSVFISNENNKFYFEILTDTTGKVLDITEMKLFNGITIKEFCEFSKIILEKNNYCIYNPNPDISFEKFIDINKGRLQYKQMISSIVLRKLE